MSGFLNFAQSHGLVIRDLVRGKIARCQTESKPTHKNGAYLFDGEWGWIQDHAQHTEIILWKTDKPLTPAEREAMQKRMDDSRAQYAKDRATGQRKAAQKAAWILGQCEIEQHAYLDGKGFPDMRGNVWRKEDHNPLLVIPMFHAGALCGCQLIGVNGDKKFLTGQRTNDASFVIGHGAQVYLVEGYASALSLHALLAALKLPHTVMATFSAGNLARIAKAIPTAWIIADNDASGTGQRVASESGCQWWMPETVGQDINDLHKELGTFKASQIVRKALQ